VLKPCKSYDLQGFVVFRPSYNLILFDLKGQQIGQQKYFNKSVDQILIKKTIFTSGI